MNQLFLKYLLPRLPSLLLLLVGLGVAWIGRDYRPGTLTAMGPGYMPVLLGLLLAALALLLLATDSAGELAPVPLRPVLYVSAGLIAWALLADVAGFFPAALAQLLLSALALPRQNWRAVVVIALLLSLAAYALFVALLGMPLPAIGNL